jgi:carboxylesterase type B
MKTPVSLIASLAGLLAVSRALPAECVTSTDVVLPVSTPAVVVAPLGDRALDPRAVKTTVTLPLATVIGRSAGSIDTFNGIPFAQPPVGPLRLKPPRPLKSSAGTVDATGIAPACPQFLLSTNTDGAVLDLVATIPTFSLWDSIDIMQEDCLTVSVQRPAGMAADAKLPVLFWIYGGGFEFGSTSTYDASAMLKRGIDNNMPFVFVAVNYRVAGFGFMPGKEILADGSANLGLLDQRLGLEWVADNIARFGGDPDRVTIWGESAGSISVLDQMMLFGGNHTYKDRPLFRAAIMNSGSIAPAEPIDGPKGQAVYDAVVASAGCSSSADTLACLRGLEYSAFMRAANSVPAIFSYQALALSYMPRPDGVVLVDSPDVLAAAGSYAAVPMIIGDQEDEGTMFAMLQPNVTTTARLVDYLHSVYFHQASRDQVAAIVATYDTAISAGSPFRTGILNELYPGFKRRAAILGDLVFTLTRRLFLNNALAAHPDVPSWSYLSSYAYGTPILGSFHASDVLAHFFPVVDTYATRAVAAHYINFVHNMDPNVGIAGLKEWPRWSKAKTLMQFFATSGSLLADDLRSTSYAWIAANAPFLRV